MKTIRILVTVAAFTPLTLPAQSEPATGAGAHPVTSAGAGRLPHIHFEGANLSEVVTYLQAKSKEAGHDPDIDPINVVITPGLEVQRLPSLSLRNVSPTEVLTVATTVLGLQLEPVNGDAGAPIAWLIKNPNAQGLGGSSAGGVGVSAPPVTPPVVVPGDPGANASGFSSGGGPILYPSNGSPYATGVPYAVQIAASSATGGAGGGTAPSQSRVFGVASLIALEKGDPDTREKARLEKLDRLIISLEKMANDQGSKAQINPYSELDVLVVKSADPAVLALIAEAIEAMKSNAKSDHSAQSREEALRAEMNALKGQLSIIQTEKDAQRQTLLDQIELLKAVSRTEDAPRKR